MAEIKAAQVMELRKKSGAGIMDAKKALVASDGDMDKAMDYLREKGIAKAAKKSDKIAAEGLTDIVVDGNTAAIVELNSETDFVAASDPFKAALNDVAKKIVEANPDQVAAYKGGRDKLFGFFVGQVMKETKGRANPQVVNKLLHDLLDN